MYLILTLIMEICSSKRKRCKNKSNLKQLDATENTKELNIEYVRITNVNIEKKLKGNVDSIEKFIFEKNLYFLIMPYDTNILLQRRENLISYFSPFLHNSKLIDKDFFIENNLEKNNQNIHPIYRLQIFFNNIQEKITMHKDELSDFNILRNNEESNESFQNIFICEKNIESRILDILNCLIKKFFIEINLYDEYKKTKTLLDEIDITEKPIDTNKKNHMIFF